MENKIKITPPNGWEIDVEKSNLSTGDIVYKEKKIVVKNLPKTWEDLNYVCGYSLTPYGKIIFESGKKANCDIHKIIFQSKELAESSLYCAMYSQLLNAYKNEPITAFIDIAKEYEEKLRPMLSLFFGEYAKEAFYLGLLLQLRDLYNGKWKPNFLDSIEDKYCIEYQHDEISLVLLKTTHKLLAFKSSQVRNTFLTHFKNIISMAKPLL